MIEGFGAVIESFLVAYGAGAVFLLSIAEEFLLVVPTSLFFITAGFFFINPEFPPAAALAGAFYRVGIPGALGTVVSGVMIYGVVYAGGRRLVRRFGKYVGLKGEDIERLRNWFRRGYVDEAMLVGLRAAPIFPVGIVSVFCGLVRLNLWEFVWTTFVGTLLRLTGLSFLGWYLGQGYVGYVPRIAAVEQYFFLGALMVLFFILIYLYFQSSRVVEK